MNLIWLRNIFILAGFVCIAFLFGFNLGEYQGRWKSAPTSASVTGIRPKDSSGQVDFSLFWDVWNRVSQQFFDKKAIDSQKMVYGAISGMVASLGDPYTVFLPPVQNKETKDDLGGTFEGIGAQLGVKDKKIVIIAPLKGTPAEKAGLRAGDWIVKVEDKETLNLSLPEVISLIRGRKGTFVNLSLIRANTEKPIEVSVKRDTITVASVEWEIKRVRPSECKANGSCKEVKETCKDCSRIVYLKLTRFGDQTQKEWEKAVASIIREMKSSPGVRGLVFDLRNNPGGYLNGSVFIASEFFDDGVVVIQEYADGKRQEQQVNRKGQLLTVPLVVLVNKGSASASEIVAGALKDHKRAVLIGEKTFGKGSIQEAQELPGGSGIHITTARWLTPSGIWINGTGLEPEIVVVNNEDNPDEDLQLEKAMSHLVQ